MYFILKNKKIYFKDYKLKCVVGKRGITKNKKEGDLCTPEGVFKFKNVFYRADRVKKPKSILPTYKIRRNMGWCDDIKSKDYNTLIKISSNVKHEKLFLKNNSYNIIIVINFNTNPIKRGKGSAIFLHLLNRAISFTKGCIALSKKDILFFLKHVKKNSRLKII